MSLQVWVPFIDTTTPVSTYKNKGVADVTFTNIDTSTTTQVNSGKIGWAMQNSSQTAGGVVSSEPVLLGMCQSMFAWVYLTRRVSGDTVYGVVGSNRWHTTYSSSSGSYYFPTGLGLNIVASSGNVGIQRSSSKTELGDKTSTGNGSEDWNVAVSSTALSLNTWYHIGFTSDAIKGEIKVYINGVCEKTYTMVTGQKTAIVYPRDYVAIGHFGFSANYPATTTAATWHFPGKINDVRVYDHCLSGKEVEEISNAKILHYPLNNFNCTEKLYTDSIAADASGYGYHGTLVNHTSAANRFTIRKGDARYSRVSLHNGTYTQPSTHNTVDTDSYILSGTFPICTWSNNCTMCGWFRGKPSIDSTKTVGTAIQIMPFGGVNGNYPVAWFYQNSTSGLDGIYLPSKSKSGQANAFKDSSGTLVKGSTYLDDNFHHLAVTFDGSSVKLYIDGEYKGAAQYYYANDSTQYKIFNGWGTYFKSFVWVGEIADFRLYATVLSAARIKTLYQTHTAIADGNVMSNVLEE